MGTVNLGKVRDRVTGVERINGNGSAGTIDTYRVSFESSNYYDFNVTNGRNGVGQIVSFSGDSDSKNNLIVKIVNNQDKVLALLVKSSEQNDGYMQASFKVEKTAESTEGLVTTSTYAVIAYDPTGSQLFHATCELSNLATVLPVVTVTFSSGFEACLNAWCILYYDDSSTGITVDDELSDNSTNPVQNKVVTEEFNKYKSLSENYAVNIKFEDTSANILALTSDNGAGLGTDTGHWYYWNGTQYVDGGVYLSTDQALDIFTQDKKCAWIKEIYISDIGKARDISQIWNVNANPTLNNAYITFANSGGNDIVAYVLNDGSKNKMLPIIDSYDKIYGYIIIDWNLYPTSDYDPTTPLLANAYNLDYSPSIKEYITNQRVKLENANILLNGGDVVTDLYTTNLPSSINNTSYIWFPYYKWVRKINRIDYLSYAGTTYFYKITITNGVVSSSLITSVVNTSDENCKIKSVFVDVELNDNEYIGVNGAFFYDATERNYKSCSLDISTNVISSPDSQTLYFNCEYDENIVSRLKDLESFTNLKNRAILYDTKLTSNNSDITGTQTFDTYGLVVSSERLMLNKYYSVEERTINYVCKFTSNCTAQFVTIAGSSVNSTFVIDIATKNTGLMEGGLPTVRCPFLNNTDEFIVSISKMYLDYVVEIRDLNNGAVWKHTYTRNGTGGAGDGAIGTLVNVPMQWDYYAFNCTSGSMSISQILITAPKCDLLMYGDSISEPEAYYPKNQFAYSWTQLVRKAMGNKAVSSGRSGTSLDAINLRIQNELPFIKPKYCMITIGTNGGYTVSEMTTLIQYIKSLDIIPILNHIPCYNNNGDTTGFIAVNQVIDDVRANENIKGCDFDKATSVNNDGVTLDDTTMWLETYSDNSTYRHHPNMKGASRMFARILIDIPEIFE